MQGTSADACTAHPEHSLLQFQAWVHLTPHILWTVLLHPQLSYEEHSQYMDCLVCSTVLAIPCIHKCVTMCTHLHILWVVLQMARHPVHAHMARFHQHNRGVCARAAQNHWHATTRRGPTRTVD